MSSAVKGKSLKWVRAASNTVACRLIRPLLSLTRSLNFASFLVLIVLQVLGAEVVTADNFRAATHPAGRLVPVRGGLDVKGILHRSAHWGVIGQGLLGDDLLTILA